MEIVLASVAGVALLVTVSGLYMNKLKTQQRQNGLILPAQENTVQNPLSDYNNEDGYDLPDEVAPDKRDNLLYGSGKKKKTKKSKRNKSKRNKSKKNK
jgi:hypothetical protein